MSQDYPGREPPSGVQGQGSIDSPYDGGNAPETTTQPEGEPPSGLQGRGTVDDPYDGGNAPENSAAEPATEHSTISPAAAPSVNPNVTGAKSVSPTGFPEHQGSGVPQAEPTAEEAKAIAASKTEIEKNDRTASNQFEKTTGTAAEGGNFDAAKSGAGKEAKRIISEHRDVSPGTLPDGSHAETSGDRGETYEPSKMSKFKNKLGFGKS